jgi:hypothetical protein
MNVLLLATTVLDLAAIAALCWFLRRTDRARDVALEEGRAALERLRGDLADLVREAEDRARALEATIEGRAGAASRAGAERELLARRLGADPAEARLLRDLELSLGEERRA